MYRGLLDLDLELNYSVSKFQTFSKSLKRLELWLDGKQVPRAIIEAASFPEESTIGIKGARRDDHSYPIDMVTVTGGAWDARATTGASRGECKSLKNRIIEN